MAAIRSSLLVNLGKKESEEITMKQKERITMKRHCISLLLLCALIITAMPTTVFAATKVNKIVITMSKPEEGKTLPTNAKVPSSASTKVTSVKWKGSTNNGKAKANVKYTASITVKIKSGIKKTFSTGTINATVNGYKASVKRNSSTKVTVTYTFSEHEDTVLNLGTSHAKEDLNARWAALKPVNKDKNLFSKEPEAVVSPYSTGTVRDEVLTDGINMLNFARYVAGLNADVSLSNELNKKAQYGAVLMAHIGKMEHKPAQPNDMDKDFYSKGYEATSSSNLAAYDATYADAKGITEEILSQSVRAWLSDQGSSSLGHRIWCLDPVMKGTGFGVAIGATKIYSNMWVFDTNQYGTGSGTSSWNAIPWPAAGYHPTALFSEGNDWSIRLNRKHFTAKSSSVKVTVTNPSGETENCKVTIDTTYKDPVLKFKPSGKVANGNKFNVEVSGITKDGNPAVIKYSVEFFKMNTTGTSDLDLLYHDKLPAEEALVTLKSCASNYLSADDALNYIKLGFKYADTVTWKKTPVLTKATAKKKGSLKGTLQLSRGKESITIPVSIPLPILKDDKKDFYAAAAAFIKMDVSNDTTKAQVEEVIKKAVPDSKISVSVFNLYKKATKTETGQIRILLKRDTTTFGVYHTIPILGGVLPPTDDTPGTDDTPDTPPDSELSGDITYEQLLDFIHKSPSKVVVSNDTTESSLADALLALLPKDCGYTFTVYFSTKVNATVNQDGSIMARVIFNDIAHNYSSFGETVIYTIPATGVSDATEVEKIEADVKAIKKEFDARIASAKSKDDLTKKDLLNVAKNAVKNGSSVQWLNDPLFSTMSAKNGKDGWVKGTLRVEFGAEQRDIEFYAVLHLDGSITNGSK